MVRIIFLGLALSLATVASGATPSSNAKGKAASLSEAKRALFNAKRALKTAVDLCSAPGKCEQGSGANREYISILEGADRNFIEACLACSTAEKCDAERDRIRDGKRSSGIAPCE
jgi:hypothetical protein